MAARAVAIVFVPAPGNDPNACKAASQLLPPEATARVYQLLDPAAQESAGFPPAGIEPLHLTGLGLPSEREFPFRYAFQSWCMALFPWVIEHLFLRGFSEVICLDPLRLRQPETPVDDEFTANRWSQTLGEELEIVMATDQSCAAMKCTDSVRRYLQILKNERTQLAQAAVAQDQVVLALGVAAPPDELQGSVCLMADSQRHTEPDAVESCHRLDGQLAAPHNTALTNAAHVHQLYQSLIGRSPDPEGLIQFAPRVSTRKGALRLILGLARRRRNASAQSGSSHWARTLKIVTARTNFSSTERQCASTTERALGSHVSLLHAPSRVVHAPKTRVQALPCPSGINLAGYVKAELGLGEAARSLAKACASVPIDVSLIDLGYQTLHPQADHGLARRQQQRYHAIDLLYVNASHTAQTANLFKDHGPGRNRYTIGFWHWEQPELPYRDLEAFQYLDEVWAPSTFVADAIAAVAPIPVFKVPHAVDFEPSPGVKRARFGLPEDKLLVLVMYDFLSYQHRKNPEAAIAAYRLAARKHPELALVIKTINGHKHPEALAALKASVADLPGTTFVESFLSRQETWDLQACCDILLSLHRAEGFGLAPAEMMRLGKAVVATGWSANMDFMTEQNSMPVRFELNALAHDVGAYPAGPVWAEADIEHASWCLSRLVKDSELRAEVGERAALTIRNQLSPLAVGTSIRNRLAILGHWYPRLLAPPRLCFRFAQLQAHLKSTV